jgi:hypothetical protein
MKVNIYETIILSDEQRVMLANVLDGKITRRHAKRDEVKSYVWAHGADWALHLSDDHAEAFGEAEPTSTDTSTDADEDLLGLIGEDDEDLL